MAITIHDALADSTAVFDVQNLIDCGLGKLSFFGGAVEDVHRNCLALANARFTKVGPGYGQKKQTHYLLRYNYDNET
jgi:hypothetical protein